MSIINSQPLIGASGQGGYFLTKSLRFRSSVSAYLNRTLTTPTSSQKFTWSGWVKRGKLDASGYQGIFAPYSSGTVYGYIAWSQDGIRLYDRLSGGTNYLLQTTAVYRDPSAWYHIVYAVDTTQATASNRVRLYVNGVEVTSFSTSTYPTQNNSTTTNSAIAHYIGYDPSNTGYFDGYLTEVNFIDGQALTPSSFGETDAATGVWKPKKFSGTYGTNGFYLPFTDVATTSGSNAGLGKDFSGNGNYWTTNNISVTSGSTYDSMKDVPTLTDADTANYCVLNPLEKSNGTYTFSNANLNVSGSGGVSLGAGSTMSVSSGKWYWEQTITAIAASDSANAGIRNIAGNPEASGSFNGGVSGSYIYRSDGVKRNNASSSSYGASFTTNDVIGVALDLDAGTLVFYKNGSSQGTAYSSLSGTFEPIVSGDQSSGTTSYAVNFGQRPFAYTPPTGFVALNTFNLPTPAIGATASSQANKYFNAITYTGNGAASSNTTQNITTTFYPDLTWVKGRDSAFYHRLTSTGLTQPNYLSSNSTDAEGSVNDTISALASTYFQVKAAGTGGTNQSGSTYVGWVWNANSGSTVSNTAGSITSTVSANTTAGFSIVTYTGNGTSGATVGHGLGVAPSMVIVKSRSAANNWCVYHISMGNQYATLLNTTAGSYSNSNYWNNTSPTSTLFSLGNGNDTNQSSATFVAYCFAQVAGYSAFGSYTGNGSSDGTFVYLGFRPRYVLVKRTDTTANWTIRDTARNPYNSANLGLFPNLSAAEDSTSGRDIDILSNGFKIRGTDSDLNTNGGTYIYAAFAENPFKYSLAR